MLKSGRENCGQTSGWKAASATGRRLWNRGGRSALGAPQLCAGPSKDQHSQATKRCSLAGFLPWLSPPALQERPRLRAFRLPHSRGSPRSSPAAGFCSSGKIREEKGRSQIPREWGLAPRHIPEHSFCSSLTCTCQGGSLQGTGSAGDLQRTLETELGDKLCSF